jgi:DNA-binding PadR family transcriptional regulator
MGRSRGTSVPRGDVRDAILVVLARGPIHGYGIMHQLFETSGGRWRPSAGSVYPTLQVLEDEGLVTREEKEGRRVFSLTEKGLAAAAKADARGPLWDTTTSGDGNAAGSGRSGAGQDVATATPSAEIRDAMYQLSAAAAQAAQLGSPGTRAQVRTVLTEARKAIYRLLAEESEPETP